MQPAVATEWQPIDQLPDGDHRWLLSGVRRHWAPGLSRFATLSNAQPHPSQLIWMPACSMSAEFYVGIDPDAGGVSRV